jgi:hypothetical protein
MRRAWDRRKIMKWNILVATQVVVAAMTLANPFAAIGGDKNVVTTKDGVFKQEYESEEGDVKSNTVADDQKVKKEYESDDCKQKYERNKETGEIRIESEGSCAKQ